MSQPNPEESHIFEPKKTAMNDYIPRAILFYFERILEYTTAPVLALYFVSGSLFQEFFQILLKGIPQKELYLPIVISGLSFSFFMVVFFVDFFSGIAASRAENPNSNFIKSKLLWSSVWKLVGVSVINLFLMIFTFTFLVMDMGVLHYAFVSMIPMFMILAISYEIHSIGENIERMYGKKPDYFNFIQKLSAFIEKRIFEKIKNLLQ